MGSSSANGRFWSLQFSYELTQPDEGTQNHRFFLHRRQVYVLQLQLHAMESGHPSIVRVWLFFLVVAITAPRNGKV
jgi:hypothetical protein